MIQKESSLKKYENLILARTASHDEMLNAGLAFGPVYITWVTDAKELAFGLGNVPLDIVKKRLESINSNLFELARAIFQGPNIPIEHHLLVEHRDSVSKAIESLDESLNSKELNSAFNDYGNFLGSIYSEQMMAREDIDAYRKEKSSLTASKFSLLVSAMIANILSLIALLIFFRLSFTEE